MRHFQPQRIGRHIRFFTFSWLLSTCVIPSVIWSLMRWIQDSSRFDRPSRNAYSQPQLSCDPCNSLRGDNLQQSLCRIDLIYFANINAQVNGQTLALPLVNKNMILVSRTERKNGHTQTRSQDSIDRYHVLHCSTIFNYYICDGLLAGFMVSWCRGIGADWSKFARKVCRRAIRVRGNRKMWQNVNKPFPERKIVEEYLRVPAVNLLCEN